MISGKQRSYLKSLANTLKPTLIIGKSGLTGSVIQQLEDQLNANELVKISVLNSGGVSAQELIQELVSNLNAEFVSQLGNKMVIYRQSDEKKIELPK